MPEPLAASLQSALAALTTWLDRERIAATVIGGVAASILGRPRLTQDVDALAVLPEEDWADAVARASAYGIVPRIDDALSFARRSRVLLMRHSPSGIDLDVVFGALPFELAVVEKSTSQDVGGIVLRLPRVEDLLVLKAVARRPKDMEDIRGLLDANPGLDLTEARRWISEFATATSMSDMLEEFDKLVAQSRR